MGVKKLRSVFMQYALFLTATVFIVIAVNLEMYLFGVNAGVIYPLYSISTAIEDAKGNLQSLEQLSENDIPPLCEYSIFTKDRQYKLSALAHDLKTPLTIIRGNTELLFETSLSAEQRECAEYIESSSLQMQDYVQTLIEVTKSWDSCQPCMKKVDMDSLLLELKNQIDGLCAVNNITLYWDCGQYPAYITADHDLLIRMLVNVLSNAAEHTPQGGNVTFEVWEHNSELSLGRLF